MIKIPCLIYEKLFSHDQSLLVNRIELKWFLLCVLDSEEKTGLSFQLLASSVDHSSLALFSPGYCKRGDRGENCCCNFSYSWKIWNKGAFGGS